MLRTSHPLLLQCLVSAQLAALSVMLFILETIYRLERKDTQVIIAYALDG